MWAVDAQQHAAAGTCIVSGSDSLVAGHGLLAWITDSGEGEGGRERGGEGVKVMATVTVTVTAEQGAGRRGR